MDAVNGTFDAVCCWSAAALCLPATALQACSGFMLSALVAARSYPLMRTEERMTTVTTVT